MKLLIVDELLCDIAEIVPETDLDRQVLEALFLAKFARTTRPVLDPVSEERADRQDYQHVGEGKIYGGAWTDGQYVGRLVITMSEHVPTHGLTAGQEITTPIVFSADMDGSSVRATWSIAEDSDNLFQATCGSISGIRLTLREPMAL